MKAEADKSCNYMVKRGDTYVNDQGADGALMKKCPLKPFGNKTGRNPRNQNVLLHPKLIPPKSNFSLPKIIIPYLVVSSLETQ